RAEVADVEDHTALATGPVLGDGPVAVGEGHVPPAEGDHLGAEGAVGGVQWRGAKRHLPEPTGRRTPPPSSRRARSWGGAPRWRRRPARPPRRGRGGSGRPGPGSGSPRR